MRQWFWQARRRCAPRHLAHDPEANLYQGDSKKTCKYFLAIEGEPGSYNAHVPELPAILLTGHSLDELTARAWGNSPLLGIRPNRPLAYFDATRDRHRPSA